MYLPRYRLEFPVFKRRVAVGVKWEFEVRSNLKSDLMVTVTFLMSNSCSAPLDLASISSAIYNMFRVWAQRMNLKIISGSSSKLSLMSHIAGPASELKHRRRPIVANQSADCGH